MEVLVTSPNTHRGIVTSRTIPVYHCPTNDHPPTWFALDEISSTCYCGVLSYSREHVVSRVIFQLVILVGKLRIVEASSILDQDPQGTGISTRLALNSDKTWTEFRSDLDRI